MFHLPEALGGNQYLDILGILVPPQLLVVLPVFAKLERDSYTREEPVIYGGS